MKRYQQEAPHPPWKVRLVLSKHRLVPFRITGQTSNFIAMDYQFGQL